MKQKCLAGIISTVMIVCSIISTGTVAAAQTASSNYSYVYESTILSNGIRFEQHGIQDGYDCHVDSDPICISYNNLSVDAAEVQNWLTNGTANEEIANRIVFSAWDYDLEMEAAAQVSFVLMEGLLAQEGEYIANVFFQIGNQTTIEAPLQLTVLEQKAINYYTITIQYLDASTENKIISDYTSDQMEAGASYDVTELAQMEIDGYTFQYPVGALSGQLNGDVTITAYYRNKLSPDYGYHVTVQYIDAATGEEIQPTYQTGSLYEGESYDVKNAIIDIDGYTFIKADGQLEGTIWNDTTVKAYYEKAKNSYTIAIRYLNKATGQEITPAYQSRDLAGNSSYDVTDIANLTIPGWKLSEINGLLSGQLTNNVEITVYYETMIIPDPEPSYNYYCATVYYIDADTGDCLQAPYQTTRLREGREYDVKSAITDIDGYTLVKTDGELEGTIWSNLTITVYYEKNPVYYTVFIRYLDKATGQEIAPAYQGEELVENSSYDVTDVANLAIPGWKLAEIRGVPSGELTDNVEIVVFYDKEQEPVPVPTVEPAPTNPTPPDRPLVPAAQLQPTEQPQPSPPSAAGELVPADEPKTTEPVEPIEPMKPIVPQIDELPNRQNELQPEFPQTEGGIGILDMVLLTVEFIIVIGLGYKIQSDLYVLRWYQAKVNRKVIV